MKRNTTLLKILLVFISFVMTTNSFSQIDSTYVPFPTDSVAWNETSCGWDGVTLVIDCTNKFFFIIGDTISLDSVFYTTLYYGNTVFDTSSAQILGGFREENKKVFFKEIGIQSTDEILYYDFSVSVGDTVWHNMNNAFGVLQSIDTILLEDSTYRRKFTFWESNAMDYQAQILEGIGNVSSNTGGVLHLRNAFFESSNRVNCVFTPNKVLFKNVNVQEHNCYVLTVSINEIEENNQLIYPNPFKNTLNFTEKLSKSKIVLYSISGQKVFVDNNFSGNSLDLHFLEKGIYYLKVNAEKSYYQKIVKL